MEQKPKVLSAGTIIGDRVRNSQGEDLGKLEEIMLDIDSGRIAYAVLSFGGFMGMGDKLFAVPWPALHVAPDEHKFVLDVPKDRLERAPGFDKDNWPDTADQSWRDQIHTYYGLDPFGEHPIKGSNITPDIVVSHGGASTGGISGTPGATGTGGTRTGGIRPGDTGEASPRAPRKGGAPFDHRGPGGVSGV